MLRLCCFLFGLLSLSSLKAGEYLLSSGVRQVWEAQLRFDWEKVHGALETVTIQEPDNLFYAFLEARTLFLKVILHDNPADLLQFRLRNQEHLEKLESASKESAFSLFCLAEFHLQSSFIHARESEPISAARALRKAFHYNDRNRERHPDFTLQLKTQVVLQALASAIPNSYRWMADLAGISASSRQALQTLQEFRSTLVNQSTYPFLKPELHFIEVFIATQLNENIRAIAVSDDIANHPLVSLSQMLHHQKQRNARAVLQAYQQFRATKASTFPYLFYLQAEALQNSGRSAASFRYFLLNSHGNWFRASALRKLAWEALLLGNPNEYTRRMQQILELEQFPSEEDRQARREAQLQRKPLPGLLRSRLLADGGLYDEALMAAQNDVHQLRDRYDSTEWHYRRGRALQGLNRGTEAVACFDQTIALGQKLPEYFAASAALQAGILLKEKNPTLARNYWRKVSRFPNHPYKKSLDAKAEAFLSL